MIKQTIVKPKTAIQKMPQNKTNAVITDDETNVFDLNKIFDTDNSSETAVVKELLTLDNIEAKTELTKEQASIIARLELKARLTNSPQLAFVIKKLEILFVSKDRKSRTEFVEAFKGVDSSRSTGSALAKFGGIFKNDK